MLVMMSWRGWILVVSARSSVEDLDPSRNSSYMYLTMYAFRRIMANRQEAPRKGSPFAPSSDEMTSQRAIASAATVTATNTAEHDVTCRR